MTSFVGVKTYLRNRHLPVKYRKNIVKIVKPLHCVVTFCQQNSHILSVSALPDIVAVSSPERRTDFNVFLIYYRISYSFQLLQQAKLLEDNMHFFLYFKSIKVGDVVTCRVSGSSKKGAVNFDVLVDENHYGKVSFTAMGTIGALRPGSSIFFMSNKIICLFWQYYFGLLSVFRCLRIGFRTFSASFRTQLLSEASFGLNSAKRHGPKVCQCRGTMLFLE